MGAGPMDAESDIRWMRAALALAERGLGRVWPSPSVGCVVVRDGRLVGAGWTQPGGRPHAEAMALEAAGERARGATGYVSLEPCNHHGRGAPCSDALVAAGLSRVVVACGDPDPRTNGAGIARMRHAGIRVDEGLLAQEARAQNEGFFRRVEEGRPLVTLKLATTLDGRIATRSGESKWITGPVARSWTHGLRAGHDAVMVGIGTALADDPELTCRLPGMEDRSPVRIVVDSRLRLPLTSKLVATARSVPTWVVTLAGGDRLRAAAFRDAGVELVEVPDGPGHEMEVEPLLGALAARGLTRVLVEGGARLAASLFRARLVDRLEWFRAPLLIGGDGLPAAMGFGIDGLAEARAFVRTAVRHAGDDLWESYARQR